MARIDPYVEWLLGTPPLRSVQEPEFCLRVVRQTNANTSKANTRLALHGISSANVEISVLDLEGKSLRSLF